MVEAKFYCPHSKTCEVDTPFTGIITISNKKYTCEKLNSEESVKHCTYLNEREQMDKQIGLLEEQIKLLGNISNRASGKL